MADKEDVGLASAIAIIAVVAWRKWRRCWAGNTLGRSVNLKVLASIDIQPQSFGFLYVIRDVHQNGLCFNTTQHKPH